MFYKIMKHYAFQVFSRLKKLIFHDLDLNFNGHCHVLRNMDKEDTIAVLYALACDTRSNLVRILTKTTSQDGPAAGRIGGPLKVAPVLSETTTPVSDWVRDAA